MDNVLSYSNFIHAVSGAMGSFLSLTVLFPFETARTRMQVDDKLKASFSGSVVKQVYTNEGLGGVYRGWSTVIVTQVITQFIYFYVFHSSRAVVYDAPENKDAITDLILGSFAGVIVVFCTVPLWAANTRLKLQGAKLSSDQYKELKHPKYNGLLHCVYSMWRLEGIRTLYAGLVPALILISAPSVQFMVYELLKRNVQAFMGVLELSGVIYFFIGAAAKTISTTVTYPVQLIQCRISAGYNKHNKKDDDSTKTAGVIGLLSDIIRSQGIFGLFRGLESKLSQTVLTAALMFLLYEKIRLIILTVMTGNV